jgi:predicted ATPase
MSDPRERLRQKFQNNRYVNFGNVITKIIVKGVRCHTNTLVEIRSPITAFSGFNGTGKSTLLQLAAASYKSNAGQFFISDFIVKGPLDRTPYADDASVHLTFETQQALDGRGLVSPGSVKLSYSVSEKRWEGYDRRPSRPVFFGGVGVFLPRSERKDYVFTNPDRLKVASTVAMSNEVRNWAAQILRCGYDSISSNELKYRTFRDNVLSTVSGGRSYSETHMGCGEGKIQCLLATLEALPPQSLVLLEEPETSLHPNAEYELGKYLIDLCLRKGHQILITTHSEMLLRALPQVSLVYLLKRNDAIQPLSSISSFQASSLMAEGFNKALTILVEDLAAKYILTELLRHRDDAFLRTVKIAIAGEIGRDGRPRGSGKDAIRQAMTSLRDAGLRIAAVLDGGESIDAEDTNRFIFKLPGSYAPEEALFQCGAVRIHLSHQYPILDLNALEGQLRAHDCHDYFKEIGKKVDCEESFLLREAARVYAPLAGPTETNTLYEQLKDAAARR